MVRQAYASPATKVMARWLRHAGKAVRQPAAVFCAGHLFVEPPGLAS